MKLNFHGSLSFNSFLYLTEGIFRPQSVEGNFSITIYLREDKFTIVNFYELLFVSISGIGDLINFRRVKVR
jgi:hypothetical protein